MKKSEINNEQLYYLEDGKVVFTPLYHIRRGTCCGNFCRHCPYIPVGIKGNKNTKQKENGNS
jgi:hypothetical protein